MSDNHPIITIDGPSGSGKGTISQWVAEELGWHLLDSGALYRVLALAAKHHAVDVDNEPALEVLAGHLDVQFQTSSETSVSRIVLESQDVTSAIRTEECGNMASLIAALPRVRTALLARQRAFQQEPGLVADGRDMGTVVFPDAELKFFLTASTEERARRRYKQLIEKGVHVNLDQILAELHARDERDKNRAASPLAVAEDAIVVDTTELSAVQAFQRIMSQVNQHFGLALASNG